MFHKLFYQNAIFLLKVIFAFFAKDIKKKDFLAYLIVFQIFLSMVICGCATSESSLKNNTSKNANYLYGEGFDDTFELAKQNAIRDLSTNLQVSIKYSSVDSTQQINNSFQTSGNNTTIVESQIKDLPAIEIDTNSYKNNKYFVRVKVEKSLMQSQIFNRLQSNEQKLDSMLHTCHSPQFQEYKQFQHIFKQYINDIQVYRILTKNMNFNSDIVQQYQRIANALTQYAITFENTHLENATIVQNIVSGELSKFVKIDNQATKHITIAFYANKTLVVNLSFYDCNNQLETFKQINTYLSLKDLQDEAKRSRLGAIIYKALENIG